MASDDYEDDREQIAGVEQDDVSSGPLLPHSLVHSVALPSVVVLAVI